MRQFVFAIGLLCVVALPAYAQDEDIEPLTVGGRGVTLVGLSGFLDKSNSAEDAFPFRMTAQVDITRFLGQRLAVRGGLIGSLSSDDDEPGGPGVSALHAVAGGFYYFTPLAMASLYSGGEYRAQLTRRAEHDAGTVLGKVGAQAAVSSRVGFFIEGGYGMRLTRGAEGERLTRIVAELGVRLKF